MNDVGMRSREYRGHRIEVREPAGEALTVDDVAPELFIDGKPMRYGRLPSGRYALEEYAFDWQDDLMTLAERFIDYQLAAGDEGAEG